MYSLVRTAVFTAVFRQGVARACVSLLTTRRVLRACVYDNEEHNDPRTQLVICRTGFLTVLQIIIVPFSHVLNIYLLRCMCTFP